MKVVHQFLFRGVILTTCVFSAASVNGQLQSGGDCSCDPSNAPSFSAGVHSGACSGGPGGIGINPVRKWLANDPPCDQNDPACFTCCDNELLTGYFACLSTWFAPPGEPCYDIYMCVPKCCDVAPVIGSTSGECGPIYTFYCPT